MTLAHQTKKFCYIVKHKINKINPHYVCFTACNMDKLCHKTGLLVMVISK